MFQYITEAKKRKGMHALRRIRERDWLQAGVLLLVSALLIGCLLGFDHHEAERADTAVATGVAEKQRVSADELKVTFFDVEKSDAILIEQADFRMLVDTSFDDRADVILDYFSEHGIDTLDYLIITHFDKDHVGGADKILDAVKVKRVLEPDYTVDKKQYREYREAMARNGIVPLSVTAVEHRKLGKASFAIYPPEQKQYSGNDNDMSLVISLRYGSQSFLLTGDSEMERIAELLTEPELNLKHTVLKVPHHGIKEKNSAAFLEQVYPETAVITCKNEWYVSRSVKKTLLCMDADLYLTCHGTVTCITDGNTMEILQE